MIRSFTAFAIFSLLGAAVMALPGVAPASVASEIPALRRADRLAIHQTTPNCTTQVWPDFATSCLRHTGSTSTIIEARLVTARR
jgi:hypothetical protein